MPHARRVAAVVCVAVPLLLGGCRWLSDGQLLRLRTCESTNNYRAVSRSGTYRGGYQFDARTWAEVGGSGDPAAASPDEQDLRARLLHVKGGPGRWPVCGRRL